MDDHPVVLHLPSKVLWALTDHLDEPYYGPETEAVICELIKHYIATTPPQHHVWLDDDEEGAEADADAATATAVAILVAASAPSINADNSDNSLRGYQWKQLFLPNGTELRSIFCGRSVYAKVEDEQIICDGLPITPSRLANGRGCGTRNAWKSVWLRFPNNKRWELAARCRDA